MRWKTTRTSLMAAAFLSSLFTVAFNAYSEDAEKTQAKYQVKQENLIYLYADTGLIVMELAPFIAPKSVAQFKGLVEEGFYDGLDFYRVIDGFVAQGGDVTEKKPAKHRANLAPEFTRPFTNNSDFITVQSPALLAQQTGFIQGFPAGRNVTDKQEWLLHCPGAVAMARNNEADSGSTEFYIVIGQAPRHLDRNMSVFAQVIYGMDKVQAMQRGNPNVGSGVIEDLTKRSKILKVRTGSQLANEQQMNFTRNYVDSEDFQARLQGARTLDNDFFHYKGTGNLDVCYYRPRFTFQQDK
ncbi:MAG: peptidylprolyl isomerase [Glaciecola sp.]|jgi:peptidylprolyl isomerase